jgi:hypothetical protein
MMNEKQIVLDLIKACISDEGNVRGPYHDQKTTGTTVGYGPFVEGAFFSLNELMMIKGNLNVIVKNIQVLIDAHENRFSFNVDKSKFVAELKKKTFIP